MQRSIKTYLIATGIGIAAGIISFVVAVGLAGACHCVSPTMVLFPYGAIALTLSRESISLPLMVLQFPIYSLAVAVPRTTRIRILLLLSLLLIHATSAGLALKLHNY